MATTHGITTIKNHCYTAPRQPKSKIPATIDERIQRSSSTEGLEDESSAGSSSKMRSSQRYSGTKIYTPKSLRDSLKELEKADEGDFYQQLLALKKEQKRTLKTVEKMYLSELEKQRSGFDLDENTRISLDYEPTLDIPHNSDFDPFSKGYSDEYEEETREAKSPAKDYVRDMSTRDERSIGVAPLQQKENRRRSHSDVSDSDSWPDDELEAAPRKRTLSSEGRVLYKEMFPRRSAALDVVEDLWKDFNVYDYSRDREGSPERPVKPQDTWSPCITIPKPFTMTIREAKKDSKQKTRSQRILQEELKMKKSQEEAEIQKKFRAQPVPATTFLPLYDEISRQEELRRHEVREMSKAILKSTEKPFSFIKREEAKNTLRRSKSLSNLSDLTPKKEKKMFKANPFPSNLFDLTLKDKLAEQEEYRAIKVRMRSEEMLVNSRLPMNMEARGRHYNIGKLRNKKQKQMEKKAFMTKEHTFRPNINPDVPDFDDLQWQFEKDMRKKKKEKEPTVVEPFQLRTAQLSAARKSRSLRSLERDSNELRGSRARSRERPSSARSLSRGSTARSSSRERPSSAILSSSYDTLPFGTTESARLRESKIRESLEEQRTREKQEKKGEQRRQKKLRSLRPEVARKVLANDNTWQLRRTADVKIKSFREADRARREEYDRELQEMQSRVSQRPLLFERQSQLSAKRTAERKYEDILRNAGVSEELVRSLVTKEGKIVDAESDDDADGSDVSDDDYDVTNRRSSAQGTRPLGTTVDYEDDSSDIEEDLDGES